MIITCLDAEIKERQKSLAAIEKWQPFCFRDKSAMALYLKIFVRPYSIIMPNFKFLSQNAQFPQILRIPLPLYCGILGFFYVLSLLSHICYFFLHLHCHQSMCFPPIPVVPFLCSSILFAYSLLQSCVFSQSPFFLPPVFLVVLSVHL